jgi:hypothetical protein
MGTQAAQNWVLLANLVAVGVYVCFTRRIYHASDRQAKASQDLARWQTEQWRRDSRGQEWRELIGTLTTSVLRIEAGPPPHPFAPKTVGEPTLGFAVERLDEQIREAAALRDECSHWRNEALFAAARVICDRLFITDVLEREHIREEWREIEVMSGDLPLSHQDARATNGRSVTITGFQEKWTKLRQKLVRLAQQDLGVAALAAGADIGRG